MRLEKIILVIIRAFKKVKFRPGKSLEWNLIIKFMILRNPIKI